MKKSKRMRIPPGANEWYAGVPFHDTRELTLEERYELQTQQRRLLWTGCLALILSFFTLIGMFLVLLMSEFVSIPPFVAILLMLFLLALTAWLLMTGLTRCSYAVGLSVDLRAGYLKRYALTQEDGEPYELEVLPASNRLWRVNQEMVYRWVSRKPVWVASVPEIAHVAAEWVSPPEGAPQDEPHYNWRALSETEKLELSGFANRLIIKLLPLTFFLTIWLIMLAASGLSRGDIPADPISFVIFAVIVIAVNWQFIVRCMQASRLRRDRDAGQVVILRWLLQGSDAEANRQPTLSPPVEVLPRTRFVWTENGRPAGWRLAR